MIDRAVLAHFASPHVMIMGSDAEPDYLPTLKARMKDNDVLFVCYNNHEPLIRAYYPHSTVINTGDLSTVEITEQVMTRIKTANGLAI